MPVFTNPWAFVGLIAPILIGIIYLFRNRSQPRTVSSLLLWSNQRKPSEGGLVFQGAQAPILLILEVLAVILIILAAAQPQALMNTQGVPVIVILDDSYSMLAGNEVSPREKAITALKQEFESSSMYRLRFVACGLDSEFLGPPIQSWAEAADQLKRWNCLSPGTDLSNGIMFAKSATKGRGRVLLITDHGPPKSFSGKEVQWWSFGSPLPNIAFTNAARTRFGNRDRILLEISNFGPNEQTISGRLESLPGNNLLKNWEVAMTPGDTRQLFFDLPGKTPAVQAVIPNEDLSVDNVVTLLAPQQKKVRTQIKLSNKGFAALVEKAIQATENALLSNDSPDLLITDQATSQTFNPERWELIIHEGNAPKGLIGPFAIDAEHPLAPGLSVDGLVWGVGSGTTLAGVPVILAGNRPLLTIEEEPLGNRRINLDFVPQASTLQRSPAWPILFWNLISWRQQFKPGPIEANVRLGGSIRIMAPQADTELKVRLPNGKEKVVQAIQRQCTFEANQFGLYTVETSDGQFLVAVNAVSPTESDLRKASSQKIGTWTNSTFFRRSAQDLKWVFLFLALLLLVAHQCLVARRPQGVRT